MNKLFFALAVLLAGAAACLPPAAEAPGLNLDLVPPVLLKALPAAPDRIVLEFDEEPTLQPDSIFLSPELPIAGTESEGRALVIRTGENQAIGREYRLRVTVEDKRGNAVWLIVRFFGFNPRPPRLLLNEFTTQGSAAHPDLVEIKVLAGGNLGGIAFYHGTAARFAYRFIFPPLEVGAGDFILLHVKPQGLPEERDELAARDESGGLDASAAAFDFWAPDGTGLSGNNGALSLHSQPDGALLDAVLYSTRTSDADADYRGFGSYELKEQADELFAAGGWKTAGSEGSPPEDVGLRPEDAVNPEDSTATRSLCRTASSADSDGRADWHIVPTRMASFGRDNSDEVHVP